MYGTLFCFPPNHIHRQTTKRAPTIGLLLNVPDHENERERGLWKIIKNENSQVAPPPLAAVRVSAHTHTLGVLRRYHHLACTREGSTLTLCLEGSRGFGTRHETDTTYHVRSSICESKSMVHTGTTTYTTTFLSQANIRPSSPTYPLSPRKNKLLLSNAIPPSYLFTRVSRAVASAVPPTTPPVPIFYPLPGWHLPKVRRIRKHRQARVCFVCKQRIRRDHHLHGILKKNVSTDA